MNLGCARVGMYFSTETILKAVRAHFCKNGRFFLTKVSPLIGLEKDPLRNHYWLFILKEKPLNYDYPKKLRKAFGKGTVKVCDTDLCFAKNTTRFYFDVYRIISDLEVEAIMNVIEKEVLETSDEE